MDGRRTVLGFAVLAAVLMTGTASAEPQATSGPIDTGWVFIDGHYIAPPYFVELRGVAIHINGIELLWRRYGPFWPQQLGAPRTDPGMPPKLTAESGWDEMLDSGIYWRKQAYLFAHVPRDEAWRRWLAYTQSPAAGQRSYA